MRISTVVLGVTAIMATAKEKYFTTIGFCCPSCTALIRHFLPPANNVYHLDTGAAFPSLLMAKSQAVATAAVASTRLSGGWFPRRPVVKKDVDDFDENNNVDNLTKSSYSRLEQNAVSLMAGLIRKRLTAIRNGETIELVSEERMRNNKALQFAKGRFFDLTCTADGEKVLESLFNDDEAAIEEDDVVKGAIIALQSLTTFGCQVGVKGSPEQLERRVSHLYTPNDDVEALRDLDVWDAESIRRLKYHVDQTAGLQLLDKLRWKQSAQGAFDLLVALGAWTKHENVALLRSGFPLRFTEEDEDAAMEASQQKHDPDELLGIRQNMCNEKVYTIDNVSTMDIDDGLSVEVIRKEDGSERHRLWIHISDADHFAPRGSRIFQAARRRATSLYLPQGSLPMFPSSLSSGVMSLNGNRDLKALSLGLELLPDGSVDDSSIIVTPSRVRVSYRLSYDEADEMLDEGVGYREEWQLGVLFEAAKKRRKYRIKNGSSEGFVPNPIPQSTVTTFPDPSAPDGIGISVQVQVSHNAGKNGTAVVGDGSPPEASIGNSGADPVSSSSLLVTEMMILAGEALGRFKLRCDRESEQANGDWWSDNSLELPFRSQPKPDHNSREREKRVMADLLKNNLGGGYCHAWYSRRFLQAVKISEIPYPHAGLGLACYVQWTSPIRRFGDLQVHCAVKRYLRRARVIELMLEGQQIPTQLRQEDLGSAIAGHNINGDGSAPYKDKIDFQERQGIIGVGRLLQKTSEQYWLFEYLRRLKEQDPEVTFDCLVLGCTDPERQQYAIYVYDIGLEHRYVSQKHNMRIGEKLRLRVSSVFPQAGLLTFSLANL